MKKWIFGTVLAVALASVIFSMQTDGQTVYTPPAAQNVTFTAGAWLGTGAATPVCATGFVCNSLSGVVAVTTTGTPGAANAALVTITWPAAVSSLPTCVVENYVGGSYAQFNAGYGFWPASATTTSISFNAAPAGTAATTYALAYQCTP